METCIIYDNKKDPKLIYVKSIKQSEFQSS